MLDKAAKSSHSAALGRQPQWPLVSAPHAGAARAMEPLFAYPVVWTLVLAVACTACAVRSPAGVAKANVVEAREEQSSERLLQRGRAFASIRDYTRAEQYLSAALAAGAPAGVVLPLLLRVCIEENRYRVALLYAEPPLKAHPDDFRLRFVVASLHASIGETDTALEHLRQVANGRPDDAEVQYAMAVRLRDAGHDPAGADMHFREYLRLEPNGSHASEARGALLKEVVDKPAEKAGLETGKPARAGAPTWRKVP